MTQDQELSEILDDYYAPIVLPDINRSGLKHAIEAYVTTRVKEAELSHFEYDDWEVGDDNKLRLGDFINCNHQRVFDGYEQNFEGQIIEHHDNGMPVVIYNVDPKDPENSGDYGTLQDMYMQGWTFSRLEALTTTTNGKGEDNA